jgi:protein TonB
MFESIHQDSGKNLGTQCTSMATSIMVHSVLACALVLSQVFLFEGIPGQEIAAFFARVPDALGSVTPSPPPAVPAEPRASRPSGEEAASRAHVPKEEMEMPSKIPSFLPPPAEDPVFFSTSSNPEGGPGGWGGSGPEGIAGAGLMPSLDYSALPPLKLPKPPSEAGVPVKIGVLNPSKLMYQVSPQYPILAHRMHVSGTVTLEALIDEEGTVSRVEVVDGHPLLRAAAVEAVKHWRYSPTMQNGEPIPVIATIKIAFKIER